MQRSAKPKFLWESTHYHSEGKKRFPPFLDKPNKIICGTRHWKF